MQYEKRSLEDCAKFIVDNRGRTCPVGEVGIPLIATNCLRSGSLYPTYETTRFVSAETYKTWFRGHPEPGDIIFVTKGSPGRVCLAPDPVDFCIAQDMVAIRTDESKVYPKYLFALLRSPEVLQRIENMHVGTLIPHFKKGDFDKLYLPVPDMRDQRIVGDLFFELSARIDLLQKTNVTLESIAQAIFKSWFIDFDPVRAKAEGREPDGMDSGASALFPGEFEESALGLIPKGWHLGLLGDVCENLRRQAKPGKMPPETPYIGLEHMPRRSIALNDAGTAEGLESGKFWFDRNDILFGKLRPYFHKVGLAPHSGVCSTDILVIRPKVPDFLGYVAMQVFSDELIAHTTLLSNGARMPRTSWKDVAGFKVVLPPIEVVRAYNANALALFERIYANIDSVRTLTEIRDALLPRLISGKLRIPEAQEQIEDALA